MSEQSYFIQSLTESTPQRIQESRLRLLLKEVNRKYNHTAPRGCALNYKAQCKDIDRALEANRVHEKLLNLYVKSQLKCMHNQSIERRKSPPIVRKERLIEKEHIKIKAKASCTPKVKRSPQLSPIVSKSVSPERDEYPDRFKSIPIHKDPRYSFKGQNHHVQSSLNENLEKFGVLSHICHSFHSGSKKMKERINGTLDVCRDVDRGMHTWVDNITKTSNIARNPLEQAKLMEQRKGTHSIDGNYIQYSKDGVRKDVTKMTEKIRMLGPSRIWRQNHKVFIKSIDLKIASLTDKKS